LQILDLGSGQRRGLAIRFVQARLQMLRRGRLRVRIQKFRYLATWELQLRKEYCASRLCSLASRTECLDCIPGVIDIENSIVVVFQVIAMNRNIASANQASASIRKFYPGQLRE